MIDREHALPVVRQCAVLELNRSTVYYAHQPTPSADLALMRLMGVERPSIRAPTRRTTQRSTQSRPRTSGLQAHGRMSSLHKPRHQTLALRLVSTRGLSA